MDLTFPLGDGLGDLAAGIFYVAAMKRPQPTMSAGELKSSQATPICNTLNGIRMLHHSVFGGADE